MALVWNADLARNAQNRCQQSTNLVRRPFYALLCRFPRTFGLARFSDLTGRSFAIDSRNAFASVTTAVA